MRLDEIFDNPLSWKWIEDGSIDDGAEATFVSGGATYVVTFSRLGLGCQEVAFGEVINPDGMEDGRLKINYDLVSGPKNPVRVYSTVVDIIADYVEHHEDTLSSLMMTAKDVRMMGVYKELIKRKVDPKYYNLTIKDDGYMLISRKHKTELTDG